MIIRKPGDLLTWSHALELFNEAPEQPSGLMPTCWAWTSLIDGELFTEDDGFVRNFGYKDVREDIRLQTSLPCVVVQYILQRGSSSSSFEY